MTSLLKQKRRGETRQKLLEAGSRLFAQHGVEGTTARALADESGANVASISYHFGGKAGLYRAVLEHLVAFKQQELGSVLDQVLAKCAEASTETEELLDLMRILVRDTVATLLAIPERQWISLVIMREQTTPSQHFDILHEGFLKQLYAAWTALLARLTGLEPDSRELRLRAASLIGQVAVFRTGMSSILKDLGADRLSEDHLDCIVRLVIQQIEAIVSGFSPVALGALRESTHPELQANAAQAAQPGLLAGHPLVEEGQAQIKAERERFKQILDECPVSIMAFDAQGVIFFVNRWHLQHMAQEKITTELILGLRIWELPTIARAQMGDQMRAILDGKTVQLPEVPVPSPVVGHETWQLMHGVPLLKDGCVVAGMLMREDITERKRSRTAILEAKEKAEAVARAKSEFLANMSHEIRIPLNGVLGMLQLLKMEHTPEERAEFTDMALSAGHRLLSLCNGILDFAKMDAGQLRLVREAFSLRHTLETALGVFSATGQEKGLTLSAYVDASVPELLVGDEQRIRQILLNLVSNALKFTPSGSVQVEAWAMASRRFPNKSQVFLSVSDTGIGIPDDQQTQIFERFTQVDASYTRRYEGAGLGLAIVRRIVELMGGGIDVESEVGVGTAICVHLLLDSKTSLETANSKPKHASASRPMSPLRILLVDDEPIGSLAMEDLLLRMGHEVVTAENGRSAIERLKTSDFDCVLMDIQMPELGGVEATRLIRSMKELGGKAQVPIIAQTAYAMPRDWEHFLSSGMDGYLAKPVLMEDLTKVLEEVLEKRMTNKS